MQNLSDEEEKQVLGEVLKDKLDAILEYVKDVPTIKQEVHQVRATTNEINDRLTVIEHVVEGHETDIKKLKAKTKAI